MDRSLKQKTFTVLGVIRDVILAPLPVEEKPTAYAPPARAPQPMLFERVRFTEAELYSDDEPVAEAPRVPMGRVPPHLRNRAIHEQRSALNSSFRH
jgi:hypothetical protein